MLVLTRRIGERILIGGGITVQLLQTSGGQASIGIEAPREVEIVREEIADRPAKAPHKPR